MSWCEQGSLPTPAEIRDKERGALFFSGGFSYGGITGLKTQMKEFPWTTAYLALYLRKFSSSPFAAVGLVWNAEHDPHRDLHNQKGVHNVVVPVVTSGGGLWVQEEGLSSEQCVGEVVKTEVKEGLKVDGRVLWYKPGKPVTFCANKWHSSVKSEGQQLLVVGYTPRSLHKLDLRERRELWNLGFTFLPATQDEYWTLDCHRCTITRHHKGMRRPLFVPRAQDVPFPLCRLGNIRYCEQKFSDGSVSKHMNVWRQANASVAIRAKWTGRSVFQFVVPDQDCEDLGGGPPTEFIAMQPGRKKLRKVCEDELPEGYGFGRCNGCGVLQGLSDSGDLVQTVHGGVEGMRNPALLSLTSGASGVQGPKGASGGQGSEGASGVQAPEGASGGQGSEGASGVQGPEGASGVQGPKGASGVQDPEGASGVQGLEGASGVQGPEGASGVQGPKGASGVQGPKGASGVQGLEGASGVQGPEGASGVQGPKGASGVQGPEGASGVQGSGDVSGMQGSKDASGVQGPKGELGVQTGDDASCIRGSEGSEGSLSHRGTWSMHEPSEVLDLQSADRGSQSDIGSRPGEDAKVTGDTLELWYLDDHDDEGWERCRYLVPDVAAELRACACTPSPEQQFWLESVPWKMKLDVEQEAVDLAAEHRFRSQILEALEDDRESQAGRAEVAGELAKLCALEVQVKRCADAAWSLVVEKGSAVVEGEDKLAMGYSLKTMLAVRAGGQQGAGDDTKEVPVPTEEEFLQTRLVSTEEVKRSLAEWISPMKEEYDSLVQTTGTCHPLAQEEFDAVTQDPTAAVEVLPGKLVFSIKAKSGKKKARIVGCGNHQQGPSRDKTDKHASGISAEVIRLLVRYAALKQWEIATTDVRTAFLNAPLVTPNQEILIVRVPAILRTANICTERYWRLQRALYGLDVSPKSWVIFRNQTLKEVVALTDGTPVTCFPLPQDANLWEIRRLSDGETVAMLGIYVDDLAIVASSQMLETVVDTVRRPWKTSEPEIVTDREDVSFAGYELRKENAEVPDSPEKLHQGNDKAVGNRGNFSCAICERSSEGC